MLLCWCTFKCRLVLIGSSRIQWSDSWKHLQRKIISSPGSGNWLKVLSSVLPSVQGPSHNVRTNVMNDRAGYLEDQHLSGLAILTLHDFHLAWSIHAFPPTQQPTAGRETLRQVWRQAGEILPLLQKVLLFLKPVRRLNLLVMMEESDFNDVAWEECHARYCPVAEL